MAVGVAVGAATTSLPSELHQLPLVGVRLAAVELEAWSDKDRASKMLSHLVTCCRMGSKGASRT